jgi:hypothetical protein
MELDRFENYMTKQAPCLPIVDSAIEGLACRSRGKRAATRWRGGVGGVACCESVNSNHCWPDGIMP